LGLEGWGCQTFTVNSVYVQVRKDRGGEFSPIYSKLWRCKVLAYALFTAWRVLENKIAYMVNLVRRGVAVCVGRRMSCPVTCSSFAGLLGMSGVFALSGLECRS